MDEFCEKCNAFGHVKLNNFQQYICDDCTLEDYISYVDYSSGDILINRENKSPVSLDSLLFDDPLGES